MVLLIERKLHGCYGCCLGEVIITEGLAPHGGRARHWCPQGATPAGSSRTVFALFSQPCVQTWPDTALSQWACSRHADPAPSKHAVAFGQRFFSRYALEGDSAVPHVN